MNRLDLDPNNQLAALLKEAEDNIRELKGKQRHSGLSGMLGYFVSSDDEWDISSSATDFYREFEIIFTASGLQPYPVENVQLDIRFGGTAESNKPYELPNGFWGYDGGGGNFASLYDRNPEFDVTYSDDETQYRWTFGFNIFGTLTYFIKVYASGTSDGEIIVRQTGP